MNMLHKSFLAKEKDIERKLLALPHFEKDTIQQEPPEIVALFKDYAETTSEEKIQRWKMIKQQQKNYLASWKLFDKSDKSKEQEHLKGTRKAKPGSSMDHRKRVPTQPPSLLVQMSASQEPERKPLRSVHLYSLKREALLTRKISGWIDLQMIDAVVKHLCRGKTREETVAVSTNLLRRS